MSYFDLKLEISAFRSHSLLTSGNNAANNTKLFTKDWSHCNYTPHPSSSFTWNDFDNFPSVSHINKGSFWKCLTTRSPAPLIWNGRISEVTFWTVGLALNFHIECKARWVLLLGSNNEYKPFQTVHGTSAACALCCTENTQNTAWIWSIGFSK